MKTGHSLTVKLVLDRVEELGKPLDGAMSTAPIRGQLPRRQRHRHRQLRQHRQHRRHNQRQRHQRHACQCQHLNQESQQRLRDDEQAIAEQDESMEKRPKVNPIFLWALQREQRIIEVRCEDYDKRNRIKLTKTPHGWRSIPRTSSNVYSACSCSKSSLFSKECSKTSSVSSSCNPCDVLLKRASLSPSSSSESVFSSIKNQMNHAQKNDDNEEDIVKLKNHSSSTNYHLNNDESDATTINSCRTSRKSCDISCDEDEQLDDDPDLVETDETMEQNDLVYDNYKYIETRKENSRYLTCGKTFRMIDLEKAKNDQFLQPRVILEPLSAHKIRLSSLSERMKFHNEIEMVVENEKVDNYSKNDENCKELVVENSLSVKGENTDDEIEEIEDKEDDIEELDDDNATVFEYQDRDSVDMMDDEAFLMCNDTLINQNNLSNDPEPIFYNNKPSISVTAVEKIQKTFLPDNSIVENENGQDPGEIVGKIPPLCRNYQQMPGLKPINNSMIKISSKNSLKPMDLGKNCSPRVQPSPPCSVTCSEDASRPRMAEPALIPLQFTASTGGRWKRKAPDLIEVKPTEWRRRESLKPAQQLRELIKKSGELIPDPLLVPRNCLPSLAANPGTEIPKLLVSRPELRLPQALSCPKLLADPDLLVISLAHLQQVLDAVPNEKNAIDSRAASEDSLISPKITSEGKKLVCKPIGSLMPAPMDLSKPSTASQDLRVQNRLLKQVSEVTSTARLPGDDSRLWHPLFGCRQNGEERQHRVKMPVQQLARIQQPQNYQQQQTQESGQHRASWHRTTVAS